VVPYSYIQIFELLVPKFYEFVDDSLDDNTALKFSVCLICLGFVPKVQTTILLHIN